MKKERKDESVTLSLAALTFSVYLVLAVLESFGLAKPSISLSELFIGTLATYLGRKSKWFNEDNKLEETSNEKDSYKLEETSNEKDS